LGITALTRWCYRLAARCLGAGFRPGHVKFPCGVALPIDDSSGLDPDYLALALREGAEAGVTKETDGVGGKLGARHVEIDEAIARMTVGTEREVAIGGEKGDPALAAKSAKDFVIRETPLGPHSKPTWRTGQRARRRRWRC
jgi:hypothetical protein